MILRLPIDAARLGEQHHSRGVTIQPLMDSEIRRCSVPLRQEPGNCRREVVSSFVDGRMRWQTRRFADNDQIRVFKQNKTGCELKFPVLRRPIVEQLCEVHIRFNFHAGSQLYSGAPDTGPLQRHRTGHDQLSNLCF